MKKKGLAFVNYIKSKYPMKVLLRYETASVWKDARDVSLIEAEQHKVIMKQWGSSDEGIVQELVK